MTKIALFAVLGLAITTASISAKASLDSKLSGHWLKVSENCLNTKSPLGTPQSAQDLSLTVKKQAGKFVVNTQITEQCFMTETSDVKVSKGTMVTMNKMISYTPICNRAVLDVLDPQVYVVHYIVKGASLQTTTSVLEDGGSCPKGDSLVVAYKKIP